MSEAEVERRFEMKKEFTILRRLWLFVRIVWRHDQTGFRMAWATAWEVSKIVWPGRKHMAETRQHKEFKRQVAEARKIKNDPKNVGWQGGHASHLNSAPDTDGKRTTKVPTLRQLDGDRDEG